MKHPAYLLWWLLCVVAAPAALWAQSNVEVELLAPERAFRAEARVLDASTVELQWTIAEGYYLYRDKLQFKTQSPGLSLGTPQTPPGKIKKDEFFGDVETYRDTLRVTLPVQRAGDAPSVLKLAAVSQGCADIGVCYPPQTHDFELTLPAPKLAAAPAAAAPDPLRQLGALGSSLGLGGGQDEFLPPDEAFAFSADVIDAGTATARWRIADGYYLYREKFAFRITEPADVQLRPVSLPPGKVKDDEFIGRTEVYYHDLDVILGLQRASTGASEVMLQVSYQGCADAGLCYPPATKNVALALPAGTAPTTGIAAPAPTAPPAAGAGIGTKGFLWAIVGAFGVGLLLTFTPCVLPMIPILSSIVVGQGGQSITKLRGGVLSATYVLGTAVTYTAVGVLAGATGDQLQAYFQNAWAIGIVSGILALLALSMFGLYELQMPSFIQSRLQQRTQGIQGGSLAGVFVMGMVSALIVGACVSPLLISLLGIAIAGGDPVLGGAIMFAMALGMGVILVAIGVGAGFLLPRAGAWMDRVKYVFGVLLLAVAVYLLQALPEVPVLYLWGALFIVTAVYLGATHALPEGASGWRYLWKGAGLVLLVWGVLALLGGMSGNRDILRPLPLNLVGAGLAPAGEATAQEVFERVDSLEDLEARMADARAAGKAVMLDFFATWCTDCVRMEKATFANPNVRQALRARFVALQVDVTDPNDAAGRAIKQRFGVFGPPALLFFSNSGEPRKDLNFYGFKGPEDVLAILNQNLIETGPMRTALSGYPYRRPLAAGLVLLMLAATGGCERPAPEAVLGPGATPPPLAAPQTAAGEDMIGSPRTAFSLLDMAGQRRQVSEWDGKVLVLNFWATWCPPCRREIPMFVELQRSHGPRGLQFVGIAIDDHDQVQDFIDSHGVNYPMLIGSLDAINVAKAYGNRFGALPYTVVVDRTGRIALVQAGELSHALARETIERLLQL